MLLRMRAVILHRVVVHGATTIPVPIPAISVVVSATGSIATVATITSITTIVSVSATTVITAVISIAISAPVSVATAAWRSL